MGTTVAVSSPPARQPTNHGETADRDYLGSSERETMRSKRKPEIENSHERQNAFKRRLPEQLVVSSLACVWSVQVGGGLLAKTLPRASSAAAGHTLLPMPGQGRNQQMESIPRDGRCSLLAKRWTKIPISTTRVQKNETGFRSPAVDIPSGVIDF